MNTRKQVVMMSRNVMIRLFKYALYFKKEVFLCLFIVIMYAIVSISVPIYLSYLIDQQLPLAVTESLSFKFVFMAILYFGLAVFSSLFSAFARIITQNVSHKIVTKMRQDLFKHIQNVPVSYYDRTPVGTIVSRLTGDSKFIKFLYQTLLYDTIFSVVSLINIVIILSNLDKQITVLTFVIIIVVTIVMIDFILRHIRYSILNRKAYSAVNVAVNENIVGAKMIQVFNQIKSFNENFDKVSDDYYNVMMKYTKLETFSGNTFSRFIDSLGVSLILIYASYQYAILGNTIQSGLIIVFISYITTIIWNIQNSAYSFSTLGRAFQASKHAFELFDEQTIDLKELKIDIKGNIEFKNVDFAYNRETVLHQFSLKVNAGETIGIVGHTGSGKTTLMNILMKFYPIKNGNVMIDGVDLSQIDEIDLRNQIAIVLQTPLMIEGTLKENIVMGYTFSDEEVEKVIKEVGAWYLVERNELGIHQKLEISSLSTGEKQLISFARALIKNPKLLILDEASANIDSESEVLIQKGIEKLSHNRTTFIIAHRLSTLMDADQIIVLNKGKLVERGNHQELMAINGIYAEYVRKQEK